MANKYDVRRQLHAEKANREINSFSSNLSSIDSIFSSVTNQIEENLEIAKQQQDKLDQEQALIDTQTILEEMPQALDDLCYSWSQNEDGTPVKGDRLSDSEATQKALDTYTYDYLENNGYFDGKSDTYCNYMKSYWISGVSSLRQTWSQNLVTAKEAEIQSKVSTSVDSLLKNAGSEEACDKVSNILTAQTGNGGEEKYKFEEILPNDATVEDQAEYNMKKEFYKTKSVIFNIYLQAYPEDEAEAKTAKLVPDIIKNMELNSVFSDVENKIQTDPDFDLTLYSVQKANAIKATDYSKLIGEEDIPEFSDSEIAELASSIYTNASYVVGVFQEKVANKLIPVFEDFSSAVSKGKLEDETYLTEKTVKDKLKEVAKELKLVDASGEGNVETLLKYMQTTDVNSYNTYLYLGAYNDSLANTYKVQQLLNNGTTERKEEFAKENKIEYENEADLNKKLLQYASIGGYSYLYDNPLTEEVYYDIATVGSLVSSSSSSSSGSTKTSSSTYVSPIEQEVGAKPIETLEQEGKEAYSAKNYDEDFKALEGNYQTVTFLDQALDIVKYPKFASFIESIFSKKESELTENEKIVYEKYKPIIDVLQSYGITSLNQITEDTITALKGKIETENDVLASNMADYSTILFESGKYNMLSAKNANEIKAQAQHNASIPTANTDEDGKTVTYDYSGTGYDIIDIISDAQRYEQEAERIEKENAINERKVIINNGEVYLETAQAGITVLENAKTLYNLFDDAENAEILTSMGETRENVLANLMATADITSPYLSSVMREVLGVSEGEEINWAMYDAEDFDAIIKKLENYMSNKASEMETADTELAGYEGEGYTKTGAARFIENAKNSTYNFQFSSNFRKRTKSIVGLVGLYKENITAEEAQETAEEAQGDSRYYLKCSIYKYELYGEGAGEDELFQKCKKELSALYGKDVTSEEVYKWMKQKDNSLPTDFSDTRYNDYVALENASFVQYCADQIWTAELYDPNATTPQANCDIDKTALQYMYSLYVGDDYKDKTVSELYIAVKQKFGGADTTKGFTTDFMSEDFMSEFRATADAIYDDLVNNKLVRLKSRNKELYEEAQTNVNNTIAKNKQVQADMEKDYQNSITTLTSNIAVQANNYMLSTTSDTEVYQKLYERYWAELVQKYGEKTANSILNNAIGTAQKEFYVYTNDGKSAIAQIKLSQTDLGGLAEYSAVEEYINSAMRTICDGTDMTGKTSASILSSMYQGVLQIADSNPNADRTTYISYIDGFVNNFKNYNEKNYAALFKLDKNQNAVAKSYKAGEGIGYLGFGLSWAKGETSSIPMSAVFQNSSVMDGFSSIMTMLVTDPSLDDCWIKKAATAYGINFKEGSNTIDVNDVASSSYEELVTRLDNPTNNTLIDVYGVAAADMYYQAGKFASEFIKYSSTNQFLATIGKTADGSYGQTELIITSEGPVIKTATYAGATVYVKPVYSGEGNEIASYSFYTDKDCTDLIYNLNANTRASLTSEQQEQMNVESYTAKEKAQAMAKAQTTAAEGWAQAGEFWKKVGAKFSGNEYKAPVKEKQTTNVDFTSGQEYGGTLTSEVVGVLFSDKSGRTNTEENKAKRQEYLTTIFSYEDEDGETKSATGEELIDLLAHGKIRAKQAPVEEKQTTNVDFASNYNTPAMIKKSLGQTCNYGLNQKRGSKEPPTSSIVAFHVFDETYKVTEAEIVTEATETSEGTVINYNNGDYILKDGEITAKPTASLSYEKQAKYTEMGYEASRKSNNEFTPEECANGIALLMEGYDLAFTYEDKDGNYYTYIPFGYELIAKGCFLTTK